MERITKNNKQDTNQLVDQKHKHGWDDQPEEVAVIARVGLCFSLSLRVWAITDMFVVFLARFFALLDQPC